MFRDGISSIPDEAAVNRSSLPPLWEEGIPREGEDDSGKISYNITHHYPLYPISLVWFT
jgi:hypothetical protein